MKIVIDANILFSMIIKAGKTEELLIFYNFELFAPEYLLGELENYKKFIFEKTQRNAEDFDGFLEIIKRRINIIPNSEITDYIEKATKITPYPDDMYYFAVALLLDCPIWSNDKLLKNQYLVKIYNNGDLIKLIRGL